MESTTNHILVQIAMARRLLLNTPTPPAPATPTPPATTDSTFDANVVMVLSILLCALICSLGLNSIIRCALRCSHLVPAGGQLSTASGAAATARLANTGIKKRALKTFPVVSFSNEGLNLEAECVICLSEFATGDRVKILPKCNHGFHVKCIDRWLGSHSSCPTCRHCLIETCRKIVGAAPTPSPATVVIEASTASEVSSPHLPPLSVSQPLPPPPQMAVALVEAVVISMPPLEQEDLVRIYRGASLAIKSKLVIGN